MLCALVISGLAAQTAAAAPTGTTAFTCTTGTSFSDAKCTTAGSGPFGHVAIPAGTTTEITGTNTGNTVLQGTHASVKLQLTSTSLSGTGTMTNSITGEEMFASGGGTIKYENVTVTEPSGKG